MPRVTHFEIHADDPERAIKFYQSVLGWTFTAWGPPGQYWLATTGPDIPVFGRWGGMLNAAAPGRAGRNDQRSAAGPAPARERDR